MDAWGDVELRAMGPQPLPLSDHQKLFGYQEPPVEGWACCKGLPEVWVEMKEAQTEGVHAWSLRFVGLTPTTPLGWVFYVKAPSASVQKEVLKPQSLRRYQGEIQSILFEQGVSLQSEQPLKGQVIPLAGDETFWGATFLICFEIHPLSPQLHFKFSAG